MRLGAELDATAYGGKAANLSTAFRAGLPVPKGVAFSWQEVDFIVSRVSELDDEPSSVDLGDLAEVPQAVRSSAVGEDSRAASFAGQHLSVLNVIGADAVLAAIRRVWQSGRDEAALAYRQRMGVDDDPRIGVVVQQLVTADVAGVLFTCDPVSGATDRWVIEASWGLGEAVVAGLVSPDHYIVAPSGDLVEARQGTKKVAVMPNVGGGTTQRVIEDDGWCLDDSALRDLASLGAACDRLFGPGQDIEWAVAGGTLWLLQSRPVTT
ncbi:MAG TPA: PEP/pyruvate-binding domain-containing protein [Acidimicrobiia bacterium]|nr:PEP/pyruvate-binding domain-containing protein [Acidimicrobiia bacterium]